MEEDSEARTPDESVELMLAYQAGDEAAFDRLVEIHSGPLFALLTRFLGPVAGREDLVQEVFLRVIRARERYRPTARFSTWLYTIAYNLCANDRQRRSADELSLDGAHPDARSVHQREDHGVASPSDELERGDVVAAVRRAIADLPESQRMAVLLAKYEELSYAEVAGVLGSTEKAIKSLIHRARESLRAALEPFFQQELA